MDEIDAKALAEGLSQAISDYYGAYIDPLLPTELEDFILEYLLNSNDIYIEENEGD